MKIKNVSAKKIFLIDGFGALLSAFLLGIVLVQLESIFGIPRTTLHGLAILPCLFAMYDAYFYLNSNSNYTLPLKGIAILNLSYACLSFGLALFHHQTITYVGWLYIVGEIIMLVLLSTLQIKVANQLNADI